MSNVSTARARSAQAAGAAAGRFRLVMASLALLLAVTAVASLCLGRYSLTGTEVMAVLLPDGWLSVETNRMMENIVLNVRLPRVLLAIIAGAGLAMSGAAFQALFANPLAAPDTLGVATGASFGAVLGILWGWNGNASKTYGGASYAVNGVPDIGADTMITKCTGVSTTGWANMAVGEAVWLSGHIGIYIGDGLAVECTPKWENKVQITAVGNIGSKAGYNTRTWTKHGKLPYVDYTGASTGGGTGGTSPSTPGSGGSLEASVGDTVTFTGDTQEFSAKVSSVRKVDWESLRPNFFFIFPAGALDGQPQSWLTSFRWDNGPAMLTQLNREFPTVSLLDIGAILRQVGQVLSQVSRALEVMVGLVTACGVLLLLAQVQVGMRQRHQELVVWRTLGAGKSLLRATLWAEFALLGLVSGLVAAIGAEVALAMLQTKVFDFPWAPDWRLWVLLPLTGAVLLSLCGGGLGLRLLKGKALFRQFSQ